MVAENVHFSMEEIGMWCLWAITFFGFSAEEIDSGVLPEKIINKYEIGRQILEKSICRHQPKIGYRQRRKKMNSSKRKRQYRQKQREEYFLGCHRERSLLKRLLPNAVA